MRRFVAFAISAVLAAGMSGLPATQSQAAVPRAPKVNTALAVRSTTIVVTGALPTKVVRPVTLQQKVGSKWKRLANGKTSKSGSYRFTVKATLASTSLRVYAAKVKIGKKRYPALTSKASPLSTVSVSPIAPIANEQMKVSQVLPTKAVRAVELQRKVGARWVRIGLARSSKSGGFTIASSLPATSSLRYVAPKTKVGAKTFPAYASPAFTVRVEAQSGSVSVPSAVETDQAFGATVRFSPARAGRPVQLQQRVAGTWTTVGTGTQNAAGAATITHSLSSPGAVELRAVTTAFRSAPEASTTAATITVTSAVPTPALTTHTLPSGVVGELYSTTLEASSGIGGYAYAASGLPDGLSVDEATGTISGTPTQSGTFSVRISVTDANEASDVKNVSLVIAPVVSIATTTLADAIVTESYEQTLAGQHGTAPYQWSVSGLPEGLALSESGQLSGTTTDLGTHTVEVTITDANARTATASLSLTVRPQVRVTTLSLAAAAVGEAYSAAVAAEEGTRPYAWAATGLPEGLTLSSSGTISGTPTTAGAYTVELTVTDHRGTTATTSIELAVNPAVTISTTSLDAAVYGENYTSPLAASNGTAPYAWSASGLPEGLGIDADTGQITGAATQAGVFDVVVTVTDAHGITDTLVVEFAVNPVVTITTTQVDDALAKESYTATIAATGGTLPYTWSATDLPEGLSIDADTGQLSGTPTAGGVVNAHITVTDGHGTTDAVTVTITVKDSVTITTTELPDAVINEAYTATVQAAGGNRAYTWSAAGLPEGLTIDPDTGTISGTATTSGTSWVAVKVTDAHGVVDILDLQLVVRPAVTITTTALPSGVVGEPYTTVPEAIGGTQPYSWAADGLPEGVSMNTETGEINGTPTDAAVINVQIYVIDAHGTMDSKTLQLTFNAAA